MSASATVQQIDDLYSRITEETNARFEEGANNLREISATVIRELASIRQELQRTQVGIQEDIVRRIELVGLEIDRRIGEKGSVSGREKLLMSDPRNKNIESFNGHKAEDTKNFRHWRTKVFNYIERFAPGAKTILIKCVCDEEFDFDTEIAKVPQWDSRYTEEVMRHELKVFLTDHLGEKASEIIENEDEDGFEMWRVLSQHFEPKARMSLPSMKTKINDMIRETATSYERLEELIREMDKRIRAYKERGGKYDEDDSADVIYSMMDDALKKDARRCKVVGDAGALRDHVRDEAAESRESGGHKKKPDRNAMDIGAVNDKEQDKAKEETAAAATIQPGSDGAISKLAPDQCKLCLGTGHWSNECPFNKGNGNKGKGKGKGKFGWSKGKGDKGKGKGKGKFGWNKGSGKGKGVYGIEDSQRWYSGDEQWTGLSDDWWSGGSSEPSRGFYAITRGPPAGRLSMLCNSRARPVEAVNPFARIFGSDSWADEDDSEAKSEQGASESIDSGIVSLVDGSGCFEVSGDRADEGATIHVGDTESGGGVLDFC